MLLPFGRSEDLSSNSSVARLFCMFSGTSGVILSWQLGQSILPVKILFAKRIKYLAN